MSKSSKKKRTEAIAELADYRANCRAVNNVDRIDLADRFEEGCAQAVGIAYEFRLSTMCRVLKVERSGFLVGEILPRSNHMPATLARAVGQARSIRCATCQKIAK